MKTLQMSFVREPGEDMLESIRIKAEFIKERGIIDVIPYITKEKSAIGWKFVFHDVPEPDVKFWLGFFEGKHFTIANRQNILGCYDKD